MTASRDRGASLHDAAGTPDAVGDGVQVRGPATPEEIAAVLAALQLHHRPAESDSTFERWRRQRQAVLRDNR